MRTIMFRLRYAIRMWRVVGQWRTCWYCSGVCVSEYGVADKPEDQADEELSCWTP